MDEEQKDEPKKKEKEVIPSWGQKLQEQIEKLSNQLLNQSEPVNQPVQVPVPPVPVKEEPEPEPEPIQEPEPVQKKRSLLDWLM